MTDSIVRKTMARDKINSMYDKERKKEIDEQRKGHASYLICRARGKDSCFSPVQCSRANCLHKRCAWMSLDPHKPHPTRAKRCRAGIGTAGSLSLCCMRNLGRCGSRPR